jgi:FtsH-binding integral membrane protein
MGMSLSFILLAYTAGSVYTIFISTAAMFGVMALVGYTTKTDLTKLGSLLMMALIGIIIASLINYFVGSSGLSYIISFISVIVFTGLTAYDVQKLKDISAQVEAGTEATAKMSIMGALTLYLDFINLFLALLRLFGNRK